MSEIDFHRIRSGPKSKNDSFEALSVQLFLASHIIPKASTVVVHRGDGGDGGVEAFYRLPSGELVGIQAKYFFGLDANKLAQIEDSLETALENHPTLNEYWVYVPFNLTGRVAAGRRGKSESERFEEWKKRAEGAASERGTLLEIKLCSATVIEAQMLQADPHGGMRRYWFGSNILTDQQIERGLLQAREFAGPRFTDDLDIGTDAQEALDFFGGTGDLKSWLAQVIAPLLTRFRGFQGRDAQVFTPLGEVEQDKAIDLISQVVRNLAEMKYGNATPPTSAATLELLAEVIPILESARLSQEDAFYSRHGARSDTPGFRQFHAEYMCIFPAADMDCAREIEQACIDLELALRSPPLSAATTRSLLLVGEASIGKTHAIVSAAIRRFNKGGLSVVLYGDDFTGNAPWEVLRTKLGFGAHLGREELFSCLQAAACHSALPFVIFIDALNEGPRAREWAENLPAFLQQCKPYAGIKVCVSTRDSYRHLVVDSRFDGYTFEHTGFAGREFIAMQAFAEYYELSAEITPLFAPELANPLFLQLACRTSKEEGRHVLDLSLPGFNALLEQRLKHSDNLVRKRLRYTNPRNLVRSAMLMLSGALANSLPSGQTWEGSIEALAPVVGNEITPEALLDELAHEGLVILSSADGYTFNVRLAFQRYGDVLRAISLVEQCIVAGTVDLTILGMKLKGLSDDELGLLEALAAVLPERTGAEITREELGIESGLAYRLLLQALPWRARKSISSNISGELIGALSTPDLWSLVFSTLFAMSMVPEHILNAENWLDGFLRRFNMVERDPLLSIATHQSYEANGAIRSLIRSSLSANVQCWPLESQKLATIALAWLTSVSDRRVRDMAAKGLTRVLGFQTQLCAQLIERFSSCDDDYILESIALATYSACLLEQMDRRPYVAALEAFLEYYPETSNVLVRDSIILLGSALDGLNIRKSTLCRLASYPKKSTLPTTWPLSTDVESLTELEHLPLNMKLWGSFVGPDFYRYQVEPRIVDFDLRKAGITDENIACWIMKQTMDFGYPGIDGNALKADWQMSNKYGSGRGRAGFAERLGKKYYWISFHRLCGMLADNVAQRLRWDDSVIAPPDYLWSLDVRKADLTDIRDITASRTYPDEVMEGSDYPFPPRNDDIKAWARADDFTPHGEAVIRLDQGAREWVSLYFHAADNDRGPDDARPGDAFLSVSLFYVSVLVPNGDAQRLTASIRSQLDRNDVSPYRGYFAEYPASRTYTQLIGPLDDANARSTIVPSVVQLARGNEWAYDFSWEELPSSLRVPCREIVLQLGLAWDRQRGWVDKGGELVAFAAEEDRRQGIYLRRDALNAYLAKSGKQLVFRRFAYRGLLAPGAGGSQIDINTYLRYDASEAPIVLDEEFLPFNC